MVLKTKLLQAGYDSLSPELKKEYKKVNDFYVIDGEAVDGWNVEDVSALRNALQTDRNELSTLKATLKTFDGIDPVKTKTDLAAYAALLADPSNKKLSEAERASLTKQLEEKHTAELTKFKEENTFYKSQVEKVLRENTAITAISEAKGSTKLLLPIVMSAIKVDTVDGNLVPRIVDEKGQVRITRKSGSTDPMTIKEYVESLKEVPDYRPAFSAGNMSGGGVTSNSGNNGAGGSGQFVVTPEIARNPQQYQALSQAASKAGQPLTFAE